MFIEGILSGLKANVNSRYELKTAAATSPSLVAAAHESLGFAWDSGERDIDAGDTMLFIKNLDEDDLIIDKIIVNGGNVICLWDIAIGNATTTPSGTAVTGVCLRAGVGAAPDVTSLYDETAVAQGSVIGSVRTPVTNTVIVDNPGIILPKNTYIQVDQITESTAGSVAILGHFDAE